MRVNAVLVKVHTFFLPKSVRCEQLKNQQHFFFVHKVQRHDNLTEKKQYYNSKKETHKHELCTEAHTVHIFKISLPWFESY